MLAELRQNVTLTTTLRWKQAMKHDGENSDTVAKLQLDREFEAADERLRASAALGATALTSSTFSNALMTSYGRQDRRSITNHVFR